MPEPIRYARAGRGRGVMGVGDALTQKFIVENGVVFTDRMRRYHISLISQTPLITSIVMRTQPRKSHMRLRE
jgi:hypothetical protein